MLEKEINTNAEESCHLLNRKECENNWLSKQVKEDWKKIFEVRDLFLNIVEEKRNKKHLKSSMEANVFLFINDDQYLKVLKRVNLPEILISSDVHFVDSFDHSYSEGSENSNLKIKVEVNEGKKMPEMLASFC